VRLRSERRRDVPARWAGSFARRAGLSLLEVILSLAILIMSMSAIGLLIDMGSGHEMDARLNNTAARLAQSKLSEVEAGIVPLEEAGPSPFDEDAGWTWTMTAEDQGAYLYLVTVTVTRDVRGRPFEFRVAQMMLDPAVRGSASKLSRPAPATTDGTGGSP
jgi:general secretion pathway protein I